MKIGLDIMGGDFAPNATVEGAILAYNELPEGVDLVLFGDENKVIEICEAKNYDASRFQIVHTDEFIDMAENPAKAFAKKPKSSIALGFGMLKAGQIDCFASAGSTGAMMVAAMLTIKAIPGVLRPSIASFMPNGKEVPSVILDVGINPDSKPDVLYQYGILGSLYAQHVYNISNPRVSLMNIGTEPEKGNLVTKAAHELMRDTADFNFIGNVEANDLFSNEKADVIVCDGFVGNVILKEAEAFYSLIKRRGLSDEYMDSQFNFENYGGLPVLGINAPVIIGHGISNAKAIKNMVLQSINMVEADLVSKIKQAFK